MALTHTRTYNRIGFADPYKTCNVCAGWVDGFLAVPEGEDLVLPCEHDQSYESVCPSWGPVDGCACVEHLGHRLHPLREKASRVHQP